MEKFHTNSEWEILTPFGWSDFDGVIQRSNRKIVNVTFNDKNIKCTPEHLIKLGNSFIEARDLPHIECSDTEDVYDVINVAKGNQYYTNGLISHNCEFHGSSDTLINANTLLGLLSRDPEEINNSVKIYKAPVEGRNYVMTVDVCKGRGADFSTFTIIDITTKDFEQVATFRDNLISPMIYPDLIYRFASYYNNCIVLIENNDQGTVVCNGLYYELEYENVFVQSYVKRGGIGVDMNKKTKRIGCSNLKDILESGRLMLHDKDTIYELTCFCQKGSSYEASDGNHDDMVMNLVLFAWFVSTEVFGEINPMDLKQMLHSERLLEMEEDLLDMPIIIDDGGSDYFESEEMQETRRQVENWLK